MYIRRFVLCKAEINVIVAFIWMLPATLTDTLQTFNRQTLSMRATKLFKDFFDSEKAGGLVLIACTILSLTLANSSIGTNYHNFFQTKLALIIAFSF